MAHDDEVFTPEQVDEQIEYLWDALHFVQPGQRTAPEMELIENLHRHYQQAKEDARSLDVVWQRLAQQGTALQPPSPRRTRPPQSVSLPPEHRQPSGPAAPNRRRLPRLITTIAAVFLLTVLVGGLVVGLVLVRHGSVTSNHLTGQPTSQPTGQPTSQPTGQPTAQPGQTPHVTPLPTTLAPPVVTYIGSDGNVWEKSVSQGKTIQITADAQPHGAQYSGLAWAPDGSMLAVLRTAADTSQNGAYMLLLLPADGTAPRFVTLAGPLDNQPFAWSPDSKLLAYRQVTGQYLPSGNDKEILHILNAQSGQEVKSLVFDRGPSGCGGGGFGELTITIWAAHYAYEGIDTFAWAPDQQTMLVAYACHNGPSSQIDLNTGATKSLNYPKDASYQPNGNLILGIWGSNGTLGLVDLADNHVRALVQPPPSNGQYAVYLGWSSWSHDGQTIYYEYEDGIWSIGVDGSNPHQIIPGTQLDSQHVATVQLVPSLSPDSTLLLYLQAHGSSIDDANGNPTVPETNQWYIAHADGSNPVALPQGTTEAAWQPGT